MGEPAYVNAAASQATVGPSVETVTYNDSISGNFTEEDASADDEMFYFVLWVIVVPTFFGLITVVGTAGNSLVIYVIVSRKAMRTVTNLLLLNLAIADISFLVIVVPFTAYKYASSIWPFGDLACKFMKYFLYVTSYVTVWTLVAVSALRFMTVVCSISTLAYRTKRNVIMLILAIWTMMLLVNIPALLAHETKHWDDYSYCGVKMEAVEPLFLTFFIFAYILPLVVICALYLLILQHLREAKNASLVDSSERTARASKVIILVVVVFLLSWLPSHVNSLVGLYGSLPGGASYEVFRIIWNCMAYGNSCANPFIYNYMSQDFRKAFREVICCGKLENNPGTRRHRPKKDSSSNNKTEIQTMV